MAALGKGILIPCVLHSIIWLYRGENNLSWDENPKIYKLERKEIV